jgi:hypothetical protein
VALVDRDGERDARWSRGRHGAGAIRAGTGKSGRGESGVDAGVRRLSLHLQCRVLPGPECSRAVHNFFGERAASAQRRLSQLLRVGRISLVIGVAFLVIAYLVTYTAAPSGANASTE